MNDDHITRLREVLDGLRGEAGRIERVGHTLLTAEMRRAKALHAAAELVQRAIDELADGPVAPPPHIHYRGDPPDTVPDAGEPGRLQKFDLAGDDDTPGWRRRPRTPGQGRGGGGLDES